MSHASNELQRVLEADLILVLVPNNQGLVIEGFATSDKAKTAFQHLHESTQEYIFPSLEDGSTEVSIPAIRETLNSSLECQRYLTHFSYAKLNLPDDREGAFIVFSETSLKHEHLVFLSTAATILTSALVRAQTEDQLRQAQKVEAVGLLAGGIAHDFNNLLTTIMGNTEVALARSSETSPLRKQLKQISWASTQASSMTHKLLTFSKKSLPAPAVWDVNTVLREMRPLLEQGGAPWAVLRCCYSPSPALVHIDRRDFETALLNLVLNARDAMTQAGEIQVSVTIQSSQYLPGSDKESKAVHLQVKDQGVGISEKDQKEIFKPFFTTKEEGTGLGLVTVVSLVQKAGGVVDLTSSQDQGSTFDLYFPFYEGPLTQQAQPTPLLTQDKKVRQKTAQQEPPIVLVVEDNAHVRQTVTDMLEEGGLTVREAENATVALEELEKYEEEIALVLSDSIMPGTSGSQLQEQISQRFPHIPFILMTGFSHDMTKTAEFPVLEKPLSMDELLHAIDGAIQLPRS